MQSSWFILQCVIQGLALTGVELVTLAMASLNAITFGSWWSKPLSVREPVDVYVPAPAPAPAGGVAGERHEEDDDDVDITAHGFIDVGEVRWAVVFILEPLRIVSVSGLNVLARERGHSWRKIRLIT